MYHNLNQNFLIGQINFVSCPPRLLEPGASFGLFQRRAASPSVRSAHHLDPFMIVRQQLIKSRLIALDPRLIRRSKFNLYSLQPSLTIGH